MSQPTSLDSYANVRLLRSHQVPLDPAWTARGVRTAFWRLYYSRHPGIWIGSGQTGCCLDPGSVCVIPAWLEHDRRCGSPCDCAYIHFDLVGLNRFRIMAIASTLTRVPVRDSFAGSLRHWLDCVDSGQGESLEGVCFAKGLVLLVLGECFSGMPPERLRELRQYQTVDARLQNVLELIGSNLSGDLSNTTLAHRHGMSPETLIARFKKQLGITPAQYVLEQRVKKAAERLAFTTDTLESIAEEAGFADRQHLSKVFHQRVGIPPARYRKMNREM